MFEYIEMFVLFQLTQCGHVSKHCRILRCVFFFLVFKNHHIKQKCILPIESKFQDRSLIYCAWFEYWISHFGPSFLLARTLQGTR